MNLEDAEQIETKYERWDSKQARRALFERMERKLFRRQRNRMARLNPRGRTENLKSYTAH